MKRVLLTGGGSGGHFYPLIAVSEALKAQTQTISLYYMGPEPYNQALLDKHGITFISCPSGKRRRYFSLLNFFSPFKVLWGTIVAIKKLFFIYPDVVFSKGSYTSVPVILAATFLRIPIVVHESDTKAGSANKLASRFARYVAISFAEVAELFPAEKTALTGIPIQTELLTKVAQPATTLGLPSDRPIIFVTGGSFGAERINNLIIDSLDELLPYYTILHQTGSSHQMTVSQSAAALISDSSLLEHYFVRANLTATEMNLAMTAASIIISRAGSGTIFEIAIHGKPSIIIPIPEAVSHDQHSNAYAYARSGAATVLEQQNLADGLLTAEINRIMNDQAIYTTMATAAASFAHPEAASTIASIIIGITQEHL